MTCIARYLHLIALMTLLNCPALSQGVELTFGVNRAGFKMDELKSFQESLRKTLPVPAKIGESYPSFWGYEGHLDVNIKRFQVGAFYGFNSTGSKLSYADYSGMLYYDQEIQFRQFGVGTHYNLSPDSKVQPAFVLEVGAGFTDFKLRRYLSIGDARPVEEILDFKARSTTITPGISLKYVLANRLVFKGELKYLFDFATDLTWTEDDEIHLIEGSDAVGPDWSGVRLSLMAGIRFHK